MKYGITTNITLQVRKGPDQRDEMVNQLLFGEVYSELIVQDLHRSFIKSIIE